jgi:hypothetical protein
MRSTGRVNFKVYFCSNITVTILDIIPRCLLIKTQLNSIGLSVPHAKQIISSLQTEHINTNTNANVNANANANANVTWQWYINVTTTILGIIFRPNFHLKHNVSETGFCLHLQV